MIQFQVNDMTCGHCVSVITKTVKSVDASAKVEVDLPRHQVRIIGSAGAQAFADAIRKAGFTPMSEGAAG